MGKGVCPVMITFSDKTMIEGSGNYRLIRDIMNQEGPSVWMIRSSVTVNTPIISSDSVVHIWHDGKIDIMETSHPFISDVPDDDLRELNKWCRQHGWKLSVNNRLISDRKELEFWLRMYYAGIVNSDMLKKHDEDEMNRMNIEPEEEDNYVN